MTARGIRNNNPLNLEHNGSIPWRGETMPPPDPPYCAFGTAHDGIRAGAIDLHSKWARGLTTLAKIVPVFAPPSENDTAAYVANVASFTGWAPDLKLDLSRAGDLVVLVRAMMRQEDGSVPYAAGAILAAVDDALGLPPDAVDEDPGTPPAGAPAPDAGTTEG